MTERTSTPETVDDWEADEHLLLTGGTKKGPTCTVALMLGSHPDPVKVARLRELIDDKGIVGTRLAEFVAKHGGPRPAKYQPLMRHRNRLCGCP